MRCRPAVNSHHSLFLADSSSSKCLVLQVVNRCSRLWADLNKQTLAFLLSSSSRALLNSKFGLSKAFHRAHQLSHHPNLLSHKGSRISSPRSSNSSYNLPSFRVNSSSNDSSSSRISSSPRPTSTFARQRPCSVRSTSQLRTGSL